MADYLYNLNTIIFHRLNCTNFLDENYTCLLPVIMPTNCVTVTSIICSCIDLKKMSLLDI